MFAHSGLVSSMQIHSDYYDKADSFGWISILLHWITAITIIVLWFLGKSIEFQADDAVDDRRWLHITIGLIAWLPLAARIGWRLWSGHPRAQGQTAGVHRLAQIAHYLMLVMLGLMILSGPVLAWTLTEGGALARFAHQVHEITANLLLALILLHILAALKHLMFHSDETIARIFVPKRQSP